VCGNERTLQCWQAVISSRQAYSLLNTDLQNSCKGNMDLAMWTRDPAPVLLRVMTHAQEQSSKPGIALGAAASDGAVVHGGVCLQWECFIVAAGLMTSGQCSLYRVVDSLSGTF